MIFRALLSVFIMLAIAGCGFSKPPTEQTSTTTPRPSHGPDSLSASRDMGAGPPIDFVSVSSEISSRLNGKALSSAQVARIQDAMRHLTPVNKSIYTKPDYTLAYGTANQPRKVVFFVRESFVYTGDYLETWDARMRGDTAAGYHMSDALKNILHDTNAMNAAADDSDDSTSHPSTDNTAGCEKNNPFAPGALGAQNCNGAAGSPEQMETTFMALLKKQEPPISAMTNLPPPDDTELLQELTWTPIAQSTIESTVEPPLPWRTVSRALMLPITTTVESEPYTPMVPIAINGYVTVGGIRSKRHPQTELWVIRMQYNHGKWVYDRLKLNHHNAGKIPRETEGCPSPVSAQITLRVADIDEDGALEAIIFHCPNHCGDNDCLFSTRMLVLNMASRLTVALDVAVEPGTFTFSDTQSYQVFTSLAADKNNDGHPDIHLRFACTGESDSSQSTTRHSVDRWFLWDPKSDSYSHGYTSHSLQMKSNNTE